MRLGARGVASVAHVMEHGAVAAERDDVLVRRLRIVLARGAEEREMQLELGVRAALERPADRLVTERGDAVRLGEARDLVRRLERCDRGRARR